MRLPRRRPSMPAEVARALPLRAGEPVLSAAQDDDGRWFCGTGAALLVPDRDGWRRLPWETVERATWDRDTGRLVVVETADFGQPEPTHEATLPDPHRLLELVRERVTASIVLKVFEPVEARSGITVAARRAPHSDAQPVWSVLVDPGLDADSERVRAAARRAIAAAQAEIGMAGDPSSGLDI